jgi:anaerobic selenocysteine-containing dehydrogenase
MECVIVHDLFLNETANYAHVFLPGSTFLEKDGTFTNAERRINRVRKVMAPKNGYADWEITQMLARWGRTGTTPTPRRSWRRSRPRRPLSRASPTICWKKRIGPVALQRGASRGLAHHACGRLRARQGAADDHRIRGDGRKDRPALSRCC